MANNGTVKVLEAVREAISQAKNDAFEDNGQNPALREATDKSFALCLSIVDATALTVKAIAGKTRGRKAKTEVRP